MASFGIDGASFNTNEMESLAGTDAGEALKASAHEAVFGGSGDDTITGNSGNETLFGGEGADTISGGSGIDFLVGGLGNDTLKGGDGSDVYVYMRGDGQDTISDSSGDQDMLFLSDLTLDEVTLRREGNDMVVYVLDKNNPDTPLESIDDVITIENWNTSSKRIDTLRFADGTEFALGKLDGSILSSNSGNLTGSSLSDWLEGDIDNNTLLGNAGNDVLIGKSGNDVLQGGDDDDVLSAGSGDDQLIGGDGADYLDGGSGVDTAEYSSAKFGVWVDLVDETANEIKYLSIFSNPQVWTGDVVTSFSDEQEWVAGDFNGDGKDDLFSVQEYGDGLLQYVYLSEGDGFTSVKNWTPDETWGFRDEWMTGDFNGDGKDDILTVYAAGSDDDTKLRIYLSEGDGFSEPIDWSGDTTWIYKSSQRWEVGDFNGDGKDDVFAVYERGSYIKQSVYLSEGDGFSSVEDWTPGAAYVFRDTWLTGDFTNDGTDDVVSIYGVDEQSLIKQTVYLTGTDPNIDADTLVNIENIQGSSFNDVIRGNSFSNTLWGNDGEDELNGREGDDTLVGGANNDTFVFDIQAFGQDELTDFEAGSGSDDIILFDTDVFSDFDTVLAATRDDGTSTVIKLDGENSITLKGVSKTDLHVDDFQFI
ncbi:Leukotoxin [Pseudovibrio axinellae]|uniref:Leukotoxin n=2 Tax=Pseudovibrio axinellae TaxID=989403 RepID=A0A165UJK4_9HYPH|nr:Leukotoxin [Pseudovibrio axinellae]